MLEGLVGSRTNKRLLGDFEVVILIFLEILTFNFDIVIFPELLIEEKSSRLFFLILPLDVAKMINKSLELEFCSG